MSVPDLSGFTRSTTGFATATFATIDALNEAAHMVGRIVWSDGGSHTVSSSGGIIGWRTGSSVVWSTIGTTLRVGLQDADTANGPPARGDGTFDVYTDLVQGTDTIASATYYNTAMASGTKTLTHGDYVAVVMEFIVHVATNVVTVTSSTTAIALHEHAVVTYAGGTYTGTAFLANIRIVADDGTEGTLEGAFPYSLVRTSVSFANDTATKEYANLFSLPWACKIRGIWALLTPAGAAVDAPIDAILYTDPLNTGAGVTSVKSVSHSGRVTGAANAVGMLLMPFATPYDYTANTLMAMALQPTSANDVDAHYFEVTAASVWDLHPLGQTCRAVSRGTIASTTALATYGSTARRMCIGLLINSFDDGAGAAGGSVFGAKGGVIT